MRVELESVDGKPLSRFRITRRNKMAKKPIAVETALDEAFAAHTPTSAQLNLVLRHASVAKVACLAVVRRFIAGLNDADREIKLSTHRTGLRTIDGKLLSLAELKTAEPLLYADYQSLTTATSTLKREREGSVVRTPGAATGAGVSVFSVATLKGVLDMYLPKVKGADWPHGAEFAAWIEQGVFLCNKK